ncbi:MAG: hypothetical protein JW750_09660 [Anaerolineaceae bacterium]|nr:hypothetical protein [Anaerolineaceae bacterium]
MGSMKRCLLLIILLLVAMPLGIVRAQDARDQNEEASWIIWLAMRVEATRRLDGGLTPADLEPLYQLAKDSYQQLAEAVPPDVYAKPPDEVLAGLQEMMVAKDIEFDQADPVFLFGFINQMINDAREEEYKQAIIHKVITDGGGSIDPKNPPQDANPFLQEFINDVIKPAFEQDAVDQQIGAAAAANGNSEPIQTADGQTYLPGFDFGGVNAEEDDFEVNVFDDDDGGDAQEAGALPRKPLRFSNDGTRAVGLYAQTFKPLGQDQTYAMTEQFQTTVNPGYASTGSRFSQGTWTFCFDWISDADKDGDGALDFHWSLTGSVLLDENSTDDYDQSYVVVLDPNTGNYSLGSCADQTANNAYPPFEERNDEAEEEDDDSGLTPEEKANQGTHYYTGSCDYSDGRSTNDDKSQTIIFDAASGTVNLNGSVLTKSSGNLYYQEADGLWKQVSFNLGGYSLSGLVSFETDENGQHVNETTVSCTYSK